MLALLQTPVTFKMAFDPLNEFLRTRVERGRRLLQEESHRGSRDLQVSGGEAPLASEQPASVVVGGSHRPVLPSLFALQLFVEGMDFTVEMHHIFLNSWRLPRLFLSRKEQQQVR